MRLSASGGAFPVFSAECLREEEAAVASGQREYGEFRAIAGSAGDRDIESGQNLASA
jgi:hypothetical protein